MMSLAAVAAARIAVAIRRGSPELALDDGSGAECLHDETVWPITKQVQESLGLEYFDKDSDIFFIKLLTDVLRFNKYGK
ncbi:MAG: hypothetical protein WCQ50_09430 [Spirochaetota bacterium]